MRCTECSREVRPVFVSDIDGTLADYYNGFSQFASMYHGRRIPHIAGWDGSGEMEDYMGLTKSEYRDAKLAYRQGGCKRWLDPYPHAAALMHEARALGFEIWVATTRPWMRLDNIDPDTKEWLRRNDIPYDALLYGDDKYQQLLDRVERDRIALVIDDLPEQLEKASHLGLPFFQVERPHNRHGFLRWKPSGSLFDVTALLHEKRREWDER